MGSNVHGVIQIVRRQMVWVIGAALSASLAWPLAVAFPINGGDALWVAQSSRALVQCARDQVWNSCPGTYQFGWLQHIPGIVLAWKGMDDNSIVTVLTLINLMAFGWLVMKITRLRSSSPSIRALLLMIVLIGPLYAFSVYSFSEMLMTCLIVGLVFNLLERRSLIQLFVVTLLISSSRETSILMIAPVALAVLVSQGDMIRQEMKRILCLMSASALGLASVLWFNYWKYGSLSNDHYTDPIRRVPGTVLKAKNFLAVWVSPSGGVLPFWVIGGLVAIGLPFVAVLRWKKDKRLAIVGALLLTALVLQTGLLSAWYAPFGWVTWGPRLIMPAVGAVAIAAVLLMPTLVRDVVTWLRYRLIMVGVLTIAIFLSGVSNLGFILNRAATLNWFTPPLPPLCPVTANVEIDRNFYFDCALDFAPWQLGRTVWDAGLHQVSQGWGAIFGSLVLLLVSVVLYGSQEVLSAATTSPPAIDDRRESTLSKG